ncbi:hypothetical protein LEP1GSC084_2429 [Leptospira interrogans serovar Medanensis str. L0448]|uniref:Uncharacterized protein n=1 Tax=Leptospira interrogans serovar Zanoni str. LT2156 TaxID=1001601 RepID=M6HP25_LEPIR|nr:hypothetical protein LEP1GSC077_1185 [Leptospira interrogans str. C10069]EMM96714.1 hypothetical protein LEP1GSC158_1264 [Leptospira interrogans serovar Zanoni str. LT2156]EMN35619.1 hypothetical protein LEP1GSC084_2429 [Leptospira interrogans serovar Medanensis str. L0448]EMN94549.1 hypothetical protein LEP1GSC110_2778 [Leptospira interrogans serovar Medanensis str. UT053]
MIRAREFPHLSFTEKSGFYKTNPYIKSLSQNRPSGNYYEN